MLSAGMIETATARSLLRSDFWKTDELYRGRMHVGIFQSYNSIWGIKFGGKSVFSRTGTEEILNPFWGRWLSYKEILSK